MVFATWKRGGVFARRGGLGMIAARSTAQASQFVQTTEAVATRIPEDVIASRSGQVTCVRFLV